MVTISSAGTATVISKLAAGEFALMPKSMFRGAALVMGLDKSTDEGSKYKRAVVFGGHPESSRKAPFFVSAEESAWGSTLVLKLTNPTLVLLTEQAKIVSHGSWDEDQPGSIYSVEDKCFIYARSPTGISDGVWVGIDGKVKTDSVFGSISYRGWQLVRRVDEVGGYEQLFSWPSQQTPFLKE